MSSGDLLLTIVSVLGLVALVKLSTGPGFRFSPALLFYVFLLAMQVLGFLAILDEQDPYDRLARTGMILGILGFVAGVMTVSIWSRFQASVELPALRRRFQFAEPYMAQKIAIMAIGYVLAAAILTQFYRSSGGIPLLEAITALTRGDEFLSAQILLRDRRMELTYFEASSYKGQGYIDQFRMAIVPYFVATFAVWAAFGRRRPWCFLALLTGIPALLFLLGTGQRHPTLSFLLSLSIIGYILTPPQHHRRILLIFGIVGFVFFAIMTFMLGRYTHTGSFRSDLPMVFLGISNRIVYSNSVGTLSLFHLFPNPEPFRWGWTWLSDLQGLLPGPHVGFSAWLYRRLYGDVGTAAPMCFGEMFANFGLPGVFFGAFVLGLLLQGMQVHWCRRRVFRAEHVVLYAMLSMSCARWAMGVLLGPIQYGLIALPLLFVVVQIGRLLMVVLSKTEKGIPLSEPPTTSPAR